MTHILALFIDKTEAEQYGRDVRWDFLNLEEKECSVFLTHTVINYGHRQPGP
jgi:hypothetical protein